MALDPHLQTAYRNAIRAKTAYRHALELLQLELPEEVASEIHYNGSHAQIPAEYADIAKLLSGAK